MNVIELIIEKTVINKKKIKIISAVIIFLIITALNYYTQSIPFNFSYFSKEKKSELKNTKISILSYNIGLNNQYQIEKKDSLKGIIDFFEEQNADIIVLPESRIWKKDILRSALERMYPYNITEGFKGNELYIETYIYSRYPLSNIKQIGNHYIYSADLAISNDKKMRIVACHLSSNQWHSSLTGGDGIFNNIRKGYRQRLLEVEEICDSLNTWTYLPTIVCGDMNDFSGSPTLNTLQDNISLEDAWWKSGFGYGATFSSKGLYLRLDHILFTKEINIQQIEVLHLPYSDHYPLITSFELN